MMNIHEIVIQNSHTKERLEAADKAALIKYALHLQAILKEIKSGIIKVDE